MERKCPKFRFALHEFQVNNPFPASKCPKCGGKLGIFDLKPNCPHCGCSIMYYDMDKRLEEDSIKAEAEWQKLDEILDKITPAFIKKKRAAREEKEKNEKDSSEK